MAAYSGYGAYFGIGMQGMGQRCHGWLVAVIAHHTMPRSQRRSCFEPERCCFSKVATYVSEHRAERN